MNWKGKGSKISLTETLVDIFKNTNIYKWLTRKKGKLANWQKLLLWCTAIFGFIFIIFMVANKIYFKKSKPGQRN